VDAIPVVGGTKQWNLTKVNQVQPDLILLDQEENPKSMSEEHPWPWHATHIEHLSDVAPALTDLADRLRNPDLLGLAQRWQQVAVHSNPPLTDWTDLPGVLQWGLRPSKPPSTVLYLIWKDPWMCVSRNTFIGSVLEHLGVHVPRFTTKYPSIELNNFDSATTLLLFSSEPYPFLQKQKGLQSLEFPYAVVNGESFSWFGSRSLRFLEKNLRANR
jgi:hypothetical protein